MTDKHQTQNQQSAEPDNLMASEHTEQHQETPKTKPKPNHILGMFGQLWRTFKFYTRVLLYIPLVIVVALAVIISTPFGTNAALTVASQLLPNLEIEYESGTINDHLKLAKASWNMQGINVDVDNLTLDWTPLCLMNNQVCVKTLSATKVEVDIQTAQLGSEETENKQVETADANSEPDAPFKMPVDINLNRLELAKVNVIVNDMQYSADTLDGEAIWNETGLKVERLSSQGLAVILPSSPDSETDEQNKDSTEWAMANLPEVSMPFPIIVKSLDASESLLQIGERQDKFEHILLAGTYIDTQILVNQLDVKHSYGQVNLIGEIALREHYPLSVKASALIDSIEEVPGLEKQSLELVLTNDFSQLEIDLALFGDTTLNLEGDIDLTQQHMPFTVNVVNSELHWPLNSPQYWANLDLLNLKGDINKQNGVIQGQITLEGSSPFDLQSQLTHQSQLLEISQLEIKSEAGNLNLNGNLTYGDTITWQANLNVENLRLQHIAMLNSQMPMRSRISGQLSTHGQVSDKAWQFSMENANLNGRMNGYPLSLMGNLTINQDLAINARAVQATALGAQLDLSGNANDLWDVDASLTVPDLSQWLEGARGSIDAKIDVVGTKDSPQIKLNASVASASYQGAKFDELKIEANYQPYNHHEYTLDVTVSNLLWNKYALSSIAINSQGTDTEQQTKLSTLGDSEINSLLETQTDLTKQTILASLVSYDASNRLGKWQLDAPISVSWDNIKQQGQLTSFCVSHPHNRLCLTNDVSLGNKGQADLKFTGNPGKLFAPFMSKKIQWDGEAEITSSIAWQPKTKPTADVNFIMQPGNIKLIRNENNIVNIDYQAITLLANLNEDLLQVDLKANSEGIANIDAHVNINVTPDRSLSGYINTDSVNLAPFGEFFPKLATLEGVLESKLQLAGNLMSPDVTGNIKLNDGSFELSSNPTLIDKLYIGLQLQGQSATIDGQWHMGQGASKLSGQIAWPDGQFSGDLIVKGENLAVIQPPLAILAISPDLAMTFDTQQISVKGNVDVPSGKIQIVQLADGGVAVSDDVVFNDSISALEQKVSPYGVVADLTINVGNDLTIDGLGLTGKLQGNLRLQQQAFKPPLLFGDIKVDNGNYKFMGQTLKISAGEVQFVGPLEVPNLNIEAIREIKEEDMVAGVRVSGTPMRPVVTLFSNPAKEQAEVLSYILTGRGFTNTSDQQNNSLMMGAALTLGNQFGGGALSNISSTTRDVFETFGFSNVQLDTNDDGRVAISGYIGENLMIKYGIGVFNPGYEMTVRYYLMSQLYLESVSGSISQSLDIYYSFDYD